MKVAAIQFCPTFHDTVGNLKKLSALVVEAVDNGAEIIVMPELALSGYSMMNREEAEPMAEILSDDPPPNSSMRVFRFLSSLHGVYLAWGVIEKDVTTDNLHNTQVFMCPDGTWEFHRKVNQFGNDFLWMSPGKASPPIRKITDRSGKTHKVGLLVCRDVRDRSETDKEFYEIGDADVVCLSANWGNGGFPATAWMNFVKDNNSSLIVSNRYGIETPNDFGEGGVCIISQDGTVQCDDLQWGQDCIVYGVV